MSTVGKRELFWTESLVARASGLRMHSLRPASSGRSADRRIRDSSKMKPGLSVDCTVGIGEALVARRVGRMPTGPRAATVCSPQDGALNLACL